MKTGFLITARLKSTRLPEKLLREVEGRPIFSHMIDRLKLAKRVSEIIVCTSTNPQDDRLEDIAAAHGISCFRGDEDDVVKRLSDAATSFNLDYLLSITADCPFSDPQYADKIVETFEATNADLIRALELPHGAYSYGVKPTAFRRVLDIKDDTNTEVWTRYFTDTDLFTVLDLPIEPRHKIPDLRMTLDYSEDLEFFKAVFARLYQPGKIFSLDEIIELLKVHPEITAINSHCAVGYKKRWTQQSSIKLKARYEVKSVAVIGSGSIGQRHIRNLRNLGINNITALRSKQRKELQLDRELGLKEVSDWEELWASKPDVAIVSNPTSLHLETIQQCLPNVRGIFIEKPLSNSLLGIEQLLTEIAQRRVTTFVGHNLQFHPIVKNIQRFLNRDDVGKPVVFQAQVGQWIEDWHPGRDFKSAYYARKDLGGGSLLSLIHEVHMATEFFGPARQVTAFLPKSDLVALEVDEIADVMIQHGNGTVSQLHLDMIQRPAHREGVVSCERGYISYDFVSRRVEATVAESEMLTPLAIAEDSLQQSYLDEMSTFLQFVREGKVRHEHDAWRATQSLAVVDCARIACEMNTVVALPEWCANLK